MSLRLRAATPVDAPGITAIHHSQQPVWRDPRTRQPVRYEALDRFGRWANGGPWMDEGLCAAHLQRLEEHGLPAIVAELDGTLIGEAEYYLEREPEPLGVSLHLSILYVHADWQGRGVGRLLIEAGVALARELGAAALTTQPEEAPRVQTFYARNGFSPWYHALEMQMAARPAPLPERVPLTRADLPRDLLLTIGRYQCGTQAWDTLWPAFTLEGWSTLRCGVWRTELGVLALREQAFDPAQADGYAWLPPAAPLLPVLQALQALGAEWGFQAVDVLLPAAQVPALRFALRLDYQNQIVLWRRQL